MPEFETILNDLDIQVPGDTETPETATDADATDISTDAIEARAANILNREANSKEQPSDKKEADAAKTEQPKEEGKEQKQPESKEVGFVDASKKAFFGEDGAVNTQKVSDYFLAKGKSFMQLADTPVDMPEKHETKAETVDPEKEYFKSVSDIVSTLPDILKQEADAGFTPEQTLQRLINTFNGFAEKKTRESEVQKAIKESAGKYEREVAQIRKDKMDSVINRNVAELGAHLDGLIPGMKGGQVLDKFVLAPEYGGKMLDAMFKRDNPDHDKVPEAERPAKTQEWFRSFQANRRDMAMVAEFGRAMWLLEQIPGIISHAQQVGAAKKQNEKESSGAKPSDITSGKPGVSSKLSEFFGYDSVN